MQILAPKEHAILIIIYHLIFVLFLAEKLTFLKVQPLVFLGRISYSVYLLHQYIGLQLIRIFKTYFELDTPLSILLTIPIIIGMAIVVTTYIETPAVLFIRNRYRQRQV